MTNKDVTNTDPCPICGVDTIKWGKLHICRPRLGLERDQEQKPQKQAQADPPPPSDHKAPEEVVKPVQAKGSYRYRDPEKWRAYMREYMARRRTSSKPSQ
jgi:hypothetical protein